MDIAQEVYEVTDQFPARERYGLAQQLRRAAVSISSNIAEGYGRKTHRQTFSFLENALGSTFEVESQIELALRLRLLTPEQHQSLNQRVASVGRGLEALMRHVRDDPHEPPRPK